MCSFRCSRKKNDWPHMGHTCLRLLRLDVTCDAPVDSDVKSMLPSLPLWSALRMRLNGRIFFRLGMSGKASVVVSCSVDISGAAALSSSLTASRFGSDTGSNLGGTWSMVTVSAQSSDVS